jgi:hypothetical protein
MTFSERMKEVLEQGLDATKEFAIKAGAKAQDLGERGVLIVEIKQLEAQAKKLLTRLGTEAYIAFTEQGQLSVNMDDAAIKPILEELADVKEQIETREANLRERKS